MPLKTIKQGAGLWLESSSIDAPDGALRIAQNVLLHRPGRIEPRFGWTSSYNIGGTSYRPVALFPRVSPTDETIAISYDGADYRYETVDEGVVYSTATFTMVPPGISDSLETKAAIARGSLYTTSTKGIVKQDQIGSALERAGAYSDLYPLYTPLAPTANVAGTRYALAGQETAAWVYVWVHKDGNGYTRRSPPSTPAVIDNTSGTPAKIDFDRIYLPLGIAAGDQIEIYRTLSMSNGGVAGSVTPGAEYFLAITHTVTSSEASAGYVDWGVLTDDVPEERLGVTLYTSPSQGGAVQSKEPPPSCRDLAVWQGVLWGAYTTERAVLTIEFLKSWSATDRSWDAVGWGFQTSAGGWDFTSGSATITTTDPGPVYNRVVVAGMKVGQYAFSQGSSTPESAGTYTAANTTLASVTTRITTTAASISANETLKVGDVTFTWKAAAASSTEVTIGGTDNACATNLAAKISAYGWTTTNADGNTDYSLTGTANANVVSIIDASGRGVHPTITQATNGMVPSYSATLSANALATGSAKLITFTDWLTVNNTKFYASVSSYITRLNDVGFTLPSRRGLNSNDSAVTLGGSKQAPDALGAAIGIAGYTIASSPSFGILATVDGAKLTLIARTPDVGSITVRSTVRGGAFRPDITSGVTSETQSHPGRLVWSSPSEPEAFPPLYYTDVGDPKQAIDRIVPLRDALLVFKRDGLYRVTGAPPDQWRVDPLDNGVWLQHPECVCTLENTCYAWTNRGVIAITEAGLGETISLPIQQALRAMQAFLPQGVAGPNRGFFMTTNERMRLVILGVNEGIPVGSSTSDAQYVYHLETQCWSKWDVSTRRMVWHPTLGYMLSSSSRSEWRIFRSRDYDDAGAAAYSDWQQTSLSISGTSGSAVYTIAQADVTSQVPRVGDIFDFGSGSPQYARASAVSFNFGPSTYSVTLDRTAGSTGSVSVDWYSCIDSELQWHAQTLGAPSESVHWQEMTAMLEQAVALPTTWPISMGGVTPLQQPTDVQSVTATITTPVADVIAKPVRAGVPRACCRATAFWPDLRLRTACVFWSLSDLVIKGRPAGVGTR